MSKILRLSFAGVVGIALLLMLMPPALAQEQDTDAALAIIQAINQWRVDEGLWPLKPNAVLQQMAIDQATFVLSQSDIPENIHDGKNGESPHERALLYDWPHYTLAGQIAIGENGASGSVDYAMNFWHESKTHRDTTLNPDYREIGVAALPNEFGHFFLVVFGGRPDVLPALADPAGGRLYLSNEEFEYANMYTSIQEVTRVRLFDSAGRPLSEDWLPWSSTLPLPENIGDSLVVLYSDGEHEALSVVNLRSDVALLPADMIVVAEPETPAAEVPAETITVTTPAQPTAQVDIRLVYDNNTIDVINASGAPLDMSGIVLTGNGQILPLEQFTRVADLSLIDLPKNHCLQARDESISGDVVMPEGCSWVRSLLYVTPVALFWGQGDFAVKRGELTLATCLAGGGQCAIDLP